MRWLVLAALMGIVTASSEARADFLSTSQFVGTCNQKTAEADMNMCVSYVLGVLDALAAEGRQRSTCIAKIPPDLLPKRAAIRIMVMMNQPHDAMPDLGAARSISLAAVILFPCD